MFRYMTLLVVFVQCAAGSASGKPPDIAAREWFNSPHYRLHDDRDVILLFFNTRETEAVRLVPLLNRLHGRPDTLVIGLTPESRSKVADFIREHHVRFAIGAGSRSARDFDVRKTPAVIRVGGDNRSTLDSLTTAELEEYETKRASLGVLEMTEEPWELEALIGSRADGGIRRDAVVKLYYTVDSKDFDEFAEQQIVDEGDPWVRNALEFLRTRPTMDEVRAQRDPSAAVEYARAYEADTAASEWSRAKAYADLGPTRERTTAQLVDDYWEHLAADPSSVVVRRWIARALAGPRSDPDGKLRGALMEMIPAESDPGNRLYLVGALSGVSVVGDEEVADFYDTQALSEPHYLRVKPLMEYLAHYMRTGVEDRSDVPPPPVESTP